jgi:2-dehydro-3-deoxyphosphogluconate aldolase / (4S)-4-hydroxy-2-oxoglutarate aldolase
MRCSDRAADATRRLREARVVPVATIEDPDDAVAIAQALARGGVHCIEITLRTAAGREAIRRASTVEGMLVGAGTVRSPEDARLAAAAGAAVAVARGGQGPTVAACGVRVLPW